MNIRSKLIVTMTVMLVMTTGANGIFNVLSFVKIYKKSLEDQSIYISRSLAQCFDKFRKDNLSIDDFEEFEKQCEKLLPRYENISHIKKRNRLLFSACINASFFIIAAAFILFLVISHYITKPLSDFTRYIYKLKEFGLGGADALGIPPKNEIGKLQLAFSDLIKNLETFQNKIQTHGRELEEIVEKRTFELQQTDKQLRLNIAARTKAEKAAKECEERGKILMNAFQTGIVITNSEDHTIVDANHVALTLLNIDLEDIKGKDRRIFFLPMLSSSKEFLHQNPTIDSSEGVLKAKDGIEIPISITSTPIMLNSQPHTIESFTDLRRYKTAVKERDRFERQLRQSQKLESIGSLAGGIAHGFNNILASIIGYTELVMQDIEKKSTAEKNLQKIFTASLRAKDLVMQILTFARRSDDELQPIRVDTIAKEALKFIRATIPATIKINQSIKSISWIMGNPAQLNQIFMNLCTNAAQAMEDKGGVLEVDIADIQIKTNAFLPTPEMKPGNYIQITVSDNGPGIAEKNLGLIFKPYFTTKKIGEGTGMGLAVVNEIVKRYGGKISVESKPNQGARFIVLLPITQKRDNSPMQKTDELPSGNERILFVDDEVLITEMGNDILGRLGYRIITCSSSLQAVELFRSAPHAFDLIITDMTMPDMTGDILAEQMLALRPDIPIILCTGYNSKISDEKALAKGIKAFAFKPIIQEDLAITVRRVLDG